MKLKVILMLAICLSPLHLSAVDETSSDTKDYSGYYVLDGKMYFYDQKTGTFTLPQEKEPSQDSQVSAGAEDVEGSLPGVGLLDGLQQEQKSFENELSSSRNYASSSGFGQHNFSGENSCLKWWSPLLGKKVYSGKEECDNDLENQLDSILSLIDKYIDNFEKVKTAEMIDSNLEKFERLKKIKLTLPMPVEAIQRIRKSGCLCKS